MTQNKRKPLVEVIFGVIKHNPVLTVGLLFFIAGAILFALLPPLVLEQIVNNLTEQKSVLWSSALLYFAMIVVSGLFDAVKEVLITFFGQKITRGLRHQMSEKLVALPADYYSQNETGKITSRFVNDVDTVESLFENGVISMFVDACKVISIIIMIFTKSLGLGMLMLIVTPLLFLMTRVFQKKMLTAQLRNRVAIGKVNNHIPETIGNIRMIHVLRKEKYMENKYDSYISECYGAMEKSNFYDSIYSPIIIFISSVIIAVMMIFSAMGGGIQSFFGMSVGTAVAVIAYVGKVFDPLESIGMEIQNIQSAVAGVKRIDEFLNEGEKKKQDREITEKLAKKHKEPIIKFERVSFGYEPEKQVLDDLDFEIGQGEKIVFSGRTGAGKSTLFKLLMGLYSPDAGHVKVYGRDADEIPDSIKRKLFGYVEQQFTLVPGTVADQISLFDSNISRAQVVAAAEKCGLHETILSLENGYDTQASEQLFSKGQLQLLSIARAVASEPAVLLLDEITANLDSETERLLMNALEAASESRTVLSISHRMYEQGEDRRVITI